MTVATARAPASPVAVTTGASTGILTWCDAIDDQEFAAQTALDQRSCQLSHAALDLGRCCSAVAPDERATMCDEQGNRITRCKWRTRLSEDALGRALDFTQGLDDFWCWLRAGLHRGWPGRRDCLAARLAAPGRCGTGRWAACGVMICAMRHSPLLGASAVLRISAMRAATGSGSVISAGLGRRKGDASGAQRRRAVIQAGSLRAALLRCSKI